MPMQVRVSGSHKNVDQPYVKVSGVWKPVQLGWVRVGGAWKNFYTAEVAVVAPTSNTSANVADLFNAAESGLWASDKKKRLIVNSARGPLVINSAPGGQVTIEVTSSGVIGGIGGTAGAPTGGAGGHALSVTVATGIIVENAGTIRGGGGGGGKGGQGGNGSTTIREPATGEIYYDGNWIGEKSTVWVTAVSEPNATIYWDSMAPIGSVNVNNTSVVIGNSTYYRGKSAGGDMGYYPYYIYRTTVTTTIGGVGGNGGRGQGADGASTNGSAGSAGGTNAGTGGTGGAGGTYGNAGSTGSTGGAGNAGSGSAGTGGGASGRAINGYNRVTYSGAGALTGGTAST